MKTSSLDAYAMASWYAYVQMAIEQGIPLAPIYKRWGTEAEILKTPFARWWRDRGATLFNETPNEVTVTDESAEFLTVRIPRGLTATKAVSQVRTAISGKVGKQYSVDQEELTYSGRVHYAKLRQYERLLRIHFDPAYSTLPMEELGEQLVKKYTAIANKSRKRAETLRSGGNPHWKKVAWIDPVNFKKVTAVEALQGVRGKSKRQVGELGYKRLRTWLESGFVTLLNVADGKFPGPQNTGLQVATTIRRRLQRLGKAELWSEHAKKGGGRTKAQLTQVQQRYNPTEQKQRAQAALRAGYGFKGSGLDHGNTIAPLTREQQQVVAGAAKKKSNK